MQMCWSEGARHLLTCSESFTELRQLINRLAIHRNWKDFMLEVENEYKQIKDSEHPPSVTSQWLAARSFADHEKGRESGWDDEAYRPDPSCEERRAVPCVQLWDDVQHIWPGLRRLC